MYFIQAKIIFNLLSLILQFPII